MAQNPFVDPDHQWSVPALSPRNVGYKMDVRLDTDSHILNGRQQIYLYNHADVPIQEVWFHLHLNAFSSNQTDMSTGIAQLRKMLSVPLNQETIGYCRILEIQANFNDVLPTLNVQGTVASVQLPFLLKPRESILLEIRFQTRLPRLVMRSGHAERFHMIAQWYPKLGLLKEDGTWICPPYGPNGEFIAPFAVYDITFDIPEDFQLISTGKSLETITENGRQQIRCYAEDVHDFAATVWDRFLTIEKTIDETALRVHYPRGHERLAERQMQALNAAFVWFRDHIGPYPYPEFNLVDVPFCGIAASGMEYPMLATGFALKLMPEWFRLPEETAIHEFGHSYFQGMVATDEFHAAWMDEGVNSYLTSLIMDQTYGECSFYGFSNFCAGAFDRFIDKDHHWLRFVKPAMASDRYPNRDAYAEAAYTKVTLLLRTIEKQIGTDTITMILQDYWKRFRFGHPDGEAFVQHLNAFTDSRFDQLIRDCIYKNTFPDATIQSIDSRPVAPFKGYVPDKDSYLEEPQVDRRVRHRIIFTKRQMPLDVPWQIELTNGEELNGILNARDDLRVVELETDRGTDIALVHIDPNRQIALDLDRTNNKIDRRPDEQRRLGTTVLFLILLEVVFHVY